MSVTVGSTNDVWLTGLQDATDNSYPTNATVVCDYLTPAGALVTGASGLAMPYVAGTTGAGTKYHGTIPASVVLSVGTTYTERVTATDFSGNVRVFNSPQVAVAG
jgi:hypothetical protein